jgi:HPt (histidine-containing phosphotransfer) domain-containing protein
MAPAETSAAPTADTAVAAVLVAVNTPITAKLIVRTLERAGHPCRLVDRGEAIAAVSGRGLAIVEFDEEAQVAPSNVIGLYDVSPEAAAKAGGLGKPVDPERLVQIVCDRLRPQPAVPSGLAPPAIDARAIEDLRRLGGDDFVKEVVGQFFRDGEVLFATLVDHVRARNVHGFQEEVHAFRSCAANIGATPVYQLCLAWRQVTEDQLASEGEDFLRRLEGEIARVRAAAP